MSKDVARSCMRWIISMDVEEDMERLFAYGTLRDEAVQVKTFGRRLEGRVDALVGYRVVMVTIEDREFVGAEEQRSLRFTGNDEDLVEGIVFKVSKNELALADAYEPQGYERVLVQLRSGSKAWVYLANPNNK